MTERPTVVFINVGSKTGVQKVISLSTKLHRGKNTLTTETTSRMQLHRSGSFFDGTDVDSRNAKGEVRGNFAT